MMQKIVLALLLATLVRLGGAQAQAPVPAPVAPAQIAPGLVPDGGRSKRPTDAGGKREAFGSTYLNHSIKGGGIAVPSCFDESRDNAACKQPESAAKPAQAQVSGTAPAPQSPSSK